MNYALRLKKCVSSFKPNTLRPISKSDRSGKTS